MDSRSLARSLSIPAAVFLSVLLAGQAAAGSTWSAPTKLAEWAWTAGMATLANGTALVAYEKCVGGAYCGSKTYVKRSTDGGATWGTRYVVPGVADMAAISGRGSAVDLAYRNSDGGLAYRRSGDSGLTFGPQLDLAYSFGSVREPSVARGPDGLVAVSWGEWPRFTDQISVRVSDDGGASFARKTSWNTSYTDWSAVAVGNGVVYVLHLNGQGMPVVRRSVDSGATWAKVLTLPDLSGSYHASLVAAGSQVFVAYVDGDDYQDVLVIRSSDKGTTWTPPSVMADDVAAPDRPMITIDGGVLRAIFNTDDGLFYTQSNDGQVWSAPEYVSRRDWGHVGFAGRAMVVFDGRLDVFVRTRNP